MTRFDISICWFRRDLRLSDHAALYQALKHSRSVVCVFVFDRAILEPLPRADRRVDFIHRSLAELKQALREHGSDLLVRHADACEAIPELARTLGAGAVFANRDDDPAAIARDDAVAAALAADGRTLLTSKDVTLFERDEVLTASGTPYSVYTPYRNAWRKKLDPFFLQAYPVERYLTALAPLPPQPFPSLPELGFAPADPGVPTGMSGAQALFAAFQPRIAHYRTLRDYPADNGVSALSVHLRFGTISIRQLAQFAWADGSDGAMCWLDELIWRDFYHQILWHHPRVGQGRSFKPEYESLAFPGDPQHFDAWCEGRTGYPLVDAAMRQLNRTGWMHNRLRMVSASFLVKDLLIDWRHGEAYFAEKLLDFDLAANNGGWQWAASTGCDAQPYFRIFNPVTQSEKFDPRGDFIRRFVPELATLDHKAIHAPWQARQLPPGFRLSHDYPAPIVDHAVQRQRALALYGKD